MGKGCSFAKFEKSVSGGGAAPLEKESRPLLKDPFLDAVNDDEMDEVPEEDAPSTGDGFVVGFIV